MVVKFNNLEWEIHEAEKDDLVKRYKEDHSENCDYVFGLTDYVTHDIYINNELLYPQKRKTLMHELTHAYLWSVGMCDIKSFSEEIVCDLVGSCSDLIVEAAEQYFKVSAKWEEIDD